MPSMLAALKEHENSENEGIRKAAVAALWELEGKDKRLKELESERSGQGDKCSGMYE